MRLGGRFGDNDDHENYLQAGKAAIVAAFQDRALLKKQFVELINRLHIRATFLEQDIDRLDSFAFPREVTRNGYTADAKHHNRRLVYRHAALRKAKEEGVICLSKACVEFRTSASTTTDRVRLSSMSYRAFVVRKPKRKSYTRNMAYEYYAEALRRRIFLLRFMSSFNSYWNRKSGLLVQTSSCIPTTTTDQESKKQLMHGILSNLGYVKDQP